jgi:SAM-dependent methyltransferase
MSVGYFRALNILRRTYARYPFTHRLHILGRFLTCPFTRTLDIIPKGARVLEIGAGHGIYTRLIAEERAEWVVAVEPDLRKSLIRIPHPRIKTVAGYDDAIRGSFDVIVVYDVIYRLPPAEREVLFQRIYERVKPGGMFILKDLDPSNRLKWMWNATQEWISDHVFHLTIGEGFYIDTPTQIAERFAKAGFVDFAKKRVDFGYPHAHIVYSGRRAAGGEQRAG